VDLLLFQIAPSVPAWRHYRNTSYSERKTIRGQCTFAHANLRKVKINARLGNGGGGLGKMGWKRVWPEWSCSVSIREEKTRPQWPAAAAAVDRICDVFNGAPIPGSTIHSVIKSSISYIRVGREKKRFHNRYGYVFTCLQNFPQSFRMWRGVAVVRNDVSEERVASFIRVKRISELGTTSSVTSRC
jgi:hypothetical protein